MGNSDSRLALPALLGSLKVSAPSNTRVRGLTSAQDETALSESVFGSMLTLERHRAERSRTPFVLMLLDAHLENGSAAGILRRAVHAVKLAKRETDLVGWYREGAILGVIFTEVKIDEKHPVTETLRSKIEAGIAKHLGAKKAAKVFFSLHIFPETWGQDDSHQGANAVLYPAFKREI